jgi:hypothetical protein
VAVGWWYYESYQTFVRRINPFSYDFCEVEEKKSEIFSLPLHKNHMKSRIYLFARKVRATHCTIVLPFIREGGDTIDFFEHSAPREHP